MFISGRDFKLKENQILDTLDKKYPIINKLYRIFEIYYAEDNYNIQDGCDGVFGDILNKEDLKELSNYFLELYNLNNKNNV